MSNFDYYKLQLKLKTPQLGTATEVSIYHEHVLQKAKKAIQKANSLAAKLSKSTQKYKGADISEKKEVEELQGILRAYCQLVGKQTEIPNSVKPILELAAEVKEEYEKALKDGEVAPATVFQKGPDGKPIVSTHMILGNLKENLKIIVNSGNKDIVKSKVAVQEALSLDVKFLEEFMNPSKDILRGDQTNAEDLPPSGRGRWVADQSDRILLERPIRFERMGKSETAIVMSEVLPEGTEMSCTMRVRAGSNLTQEHLEKLLDMGKNNGLGAWRGSGNMGSYLYKLEYLPDYQETFEDGWN